MPLVHKVVEKLTDQKAADKLQAVRESDIQSSAAAKAKAEALAEAESKARVRALIARHQARRQEEEFVSRSAEARRDALKSIDEELEIKNERI